MRKTQEEIVVEIERVMKDSEFLTGFVVDALIRLLDYEHAKQFLESGCKPSNWPEPQGPADEIRRYMSHAWDKCQGHRGLSASRSVMKLRAWAWADGRDDLVFFADSDAEYPQYGAPILARFSEAYAAPVPGNPQVRRMIEGKPCRDDCEDGCGR